MNEKEKAAVMEAVANLPESSKQFVLGYAAGVTAKVTEANEQKAEKTDAAC